MWCSTVSHRVVLSSIMGFGCVVTIGLVLPGVVSRLDYTFLLAPCTLSHCQLIKPLCPITWSKQTVSVNSSLDHSLVSFIITASGDINDVTLLWPLWMAGSPSALAYTTPWISLLCDWLASDQPLSPDWFEGDHVRILNLQNSPISLLTLVIYNNKSVIIKNIHSL